MCFELPAVITAFHFAAVESAAGERHAAMRTGVTQREDFAIGVASDGERNFEQRAFGDLTAGDFVAGEASELKGKALKGFCTESAWKLCYGCASERPGRLPRRLPDRFMQAIALALFQPPFPQPAGPAVRIDLDRSHPG